MRKYFADTYHGGIMCMHMFGKYAYHQPFFWDWSQSIPQWLTEHLFRRLDALPGYKVNLEVDSSSLEYVKMHHPDIIGRLKHYINEGKLEVVDGTVAQPYSFLQSGESCIRQFYYGQKTMREILGTTAKTYFKQEPFFFPQLPQILKKCGYTNALLRVHIAHYGQCPLINLERVIWRAPDGTCIDAVPNYLRTDNCYSMTVAVENLPRYEQDCQKSGFNSILVTTGLDVAHDADYLPSFKSDYADKLLPREVEYFKGDWITHGISDNRIKHIQQQGYKFILLSEYFKAEKPSPTVLQTRADDFDFKYKFGQFGDLILRGVREAEKSVYDAEVFASFVKMAQGPLLLTEQGRKLIWEQLLLAQNHDIQAAPTSFSYGVAAAPINIVQKLTDTSIKNSENVIEESLKYLTDNVNTWSAKNAADEPIVLVVFNQLLHSRSAIVEAAIFCKKGYARRLSLWDQNDRIQFDETKCQRYDDGSIYKLSIVFGAELPSMGYVAYYLKPSSDEPRIYAGTSDFTGILESDAIRITVGRNGLLEKVFDKNQKFEFLDTSCFRGNELTADFGRGLQESKHNNCRMSGTIGNSISTAAAAGMLGGLRYEMRYRLYHNVPRLDCELEIDFDTALKTKSIHDQFSKLRVTFNPSFKGEMFVDHPFSVDSTSKDVSAGYRFGCYTDGNYGITLVNNGNIGYFRNPEKKTDFSLLLGFGDDSYFYGPLLLSGKHVFRYSLFFHQGDWRKGKSIQKSLEVLHPPYVRQTHIHTGLLPAVNSFVGAAEDSIVASACYPEDKGICLRLWETDCQPADTSLTFGPAVSDLKETDLLDNPISKPHYSSIRFSPWEIKTLHLAL